VTKSTQSITPQLTAHTARGQSFGSKPPVRFYAVRVFYAIFFGIGALAFVFQSSQLDVVDMALIGACALASLVSFMLSVKPDTVS